MLEYTYTGTGKNKAADELADAIITEYRKAKKELDEKEELERQRRENKWYRKIARIFKRG